MMQHICRECGAPFAGGPRAWYCPSCREERKKKALAAHRARKKAGSAVRVGDIMQCELCHQNIIRSGPLQRFCPECAAIHLKEVDNAQSLEWKKNNLEKMREIKREIARKNIANGENIKSGIKGISWDKSTRRWRVAPYVDGKQIYIGKYKELDQACEVLSKFKSSLNVK